MPNSDTESREILRKLADNGFSQGNFLRFLKTQYAEAFVPEKEKIQFPVSEIDKRFSTGEILGIINLDQDCALSVVSVKQRGVKLGVRSSRKAQFDLAKKMLQFFGENPPRNSVLLRTSIVPGGLFIFYDEDGNFRLSLVTVSIQAGEKKREYSSFRRQSFFVEKGGNARTFVDRLSASPATHDGETGWTLEAFKDAFSVSALTKEFYQELFAWFEWARSPEAGVTFPNLVSNPNDDRDSLEIKIIRLITRIMFVWFIRKKDLVPAKLFDKDELKKILKNFSPESKKSGDYYNAILQNLFFATLNRSREDESGAPRGFAERKGNTDVKTLYRYEELFGISKKEVIKLFDDVPFLNGGLFECLDKTKTLNGVEQAFYYDGFSRNADRSAKNKHYKKRAFIPNALFFERERGLFEIFSRYNFTVDENSPTDADVSLDAEMLGRVFENLLACVNPETNEQARKSSGSFYTPREIVEYMVDESLLAYIGKTCGKREMKMLREILEEKNNLTEISTHDTHFVENVTTALKSVKILDPACGSGAFPMGCLSRIIDILEKLGKLDATKPTAVYREKLHIIEKCIFGIDKQSIAVQISKLRFFISLICESQKDESKPNFGIPTLPNLETKFVAADSLLQMKKVEQHNLFEDPEIEPTTKELIGVREAHFSAPTATKKSNLRKKDEELRSKLARLLKRNDYFAPDDAKQLARWNPYDQNTEADFFDPEWMFGVRDGFDIVIGNPPYIRLQRDSGKLADLYDKCGYKTFDRNGDIYCLFYERGHQLLKQGGHLCFITSNKWMRAGYGERTRQFFAQETDPQLLIDFADVKIFESATVDTNILLFSKAPNRHHTLCAVAGAAMPPSPNAGGATPSSPTSEDETTGVSPTNNPQQPNGGEGAAAPALTIGDVGVAAPVRCAFASSDSWVILSPIEQRIKRKIEAVGTPLKDWDIQIYRGVLTGCNEAFIISTEKRDEILSRCQSEEERARTAELIRPILRGRDIKRYGYNWANLWLINTHNGIKGKLERIHIEDYPAVKAHLDQYWNKISTRADKGDTPYNLRNCAYMEDFSKPKIVYPETTQGAYFAYDNDSMFLDKTCFMLISEDAVYLQATLSSRLFEFAYKNIFSSVELGEHGYQYNKHALIKLPVCKKHNNVSQYNDAYFYALYKISPEEIAFIEK